VRKVVWNELDAPARRDALARPAQRSDPALQLGVREIVEDVRLRGWKGLAEQAERLDGEAPHLVPVKPVAAEARGTLASGQVEAIELAATAIRAFHGGSLPAEHQVETMPGVTVRKVWRAIDRVGLYIPGGKTPLFSTLLMLAIPARAAGVREIVAVTPPRPEGGLDPLIALAAELSGPWGAPKPLPRSPSARAAFLESTRFAVPATPGSRRRRHWSLPSPAGPPSTCPRGQAS
jgi:histidinol dehydrogenase